MRCDSLFYQLFTQLPQTLFDLLGVDYPLGYRFDSVEIKQTAFRIDGVFVPPEPSGIVYFCEVQFQRDNTLYERLFAEIFLYLRLYRGTFSDWRAVVIYPNRQVEQDSITPYQLLLDSGQVQRVYLNELGNPATLPLGVALMQLSALTAAEMPTVAQQLAQRSRTAPEPIRGAIMELLTTIVLYKFEHLSREEVEQMLGFTKDELKQTRFYRELYDEIYTTAKAEGEMLGKQQGLEEGLQQGRQQGLQQGRQEGIKEGESLIVLQLLKRRFGDLPADIEQKIRNLSPERIAALADILLDIASLEAVNAWLQEHSED
ncbi:Rpn family recombination-promoting nuclease/putative transposase [Thermosynechococcus sp. FA-CM-4201]